MAENKKKVRRLDDAVAWEHYNAGKSDDQIAEAMGVCNETIRNWRRRYGVEANAPEKKKKRRIKLTPLEEDAKAARELGMTYGQYKVYQQQHCVRKGGKR